MQSWDGQNLDKLFKLWAFVQRLRRTSGGEHVRVAELVDEEKFRVWFVITAAQLESESTVSEAMCGVYHGFPVEASSDAWGLRIWGSPDEDEVLFFV